MRVDLNDGARPRNFDIFIPRQRRHDPARGSQATRTPQSHRTELFKISKPVTAAQISAVIGGGDYDSIEEIQRQHDMSWPLTTGEAVFTNG